MLQKIISTTLQLFFAALGLALIVALFFIGIIALWYFILIGSVIWLARSLYMGWQRRQQGPVKVDEVEVIVHREVSQKPHQGRVIDHE